MARFNILSLIFILSSAHAFSPQVQSFSMRTSASSTSLNMAVETIADVRKTIKVMTAENFSESLVSLEPQLLTCGSSVYRKSMKRIARKAKEVGAVLPEDYAKEAKATLKRRTKQNEFIKGKEEARIAAEEEAAAAAAAAAEEASVEEPVPVEA